MDYVITLVVDSDRLRLPQTFVDSMAQLLSMQDIRVEKTAWVKEGVAIDLFIPSPTGGGFASAEALAKAEGWGHTRSDKTNNAPLPTFPLRGEELNTIVQDTIIGHPFDAIVQPVAGRRKKLLVADMESTMVDIECLDELAKYVGLEEKISGITARAMNGELDFNAALTERVALLTGLPETVLQEVMDEKVKPMPGALHLVSAMKEHGAYTLMVTGGFDFFADRVKDMLGFDEVRANRLEIKDGKLTGKVIPPIIDKQAKLAAMLETCKKLKITPDEVVAVGDGANDLPMLLAAGLGVAYHAKPTVRQQAKARLDHANLSALVYAQGVVE